MKIIGSALYANTSLVENVRNTGVINFIDIDGTLAMGGMPTTTELEARRLSRHEARRRGASVFITARTPELVMLSHEYQRSVEMGFLRPPPRAVYDRDLEYRFSVPLEDLTEYRDVVGGVDSIASMGVGVMVAGNGGYAMDREYEESMVGEIVCGMWRELVWDVLLRADNDGDIVRALAPLEFPQNYRDAQIDVAPLPYRFQLDWNGDGAGDAKRSMRQRLVSWFRSRPELQVDFVDESNPAKGRYTLYLLHRAFNKERMHERIVEQVLLHTGMSPRNLTVNVFGDTLTDLRQIEAGGWRFGQSFDGSSVNMNFVLVGASRLSDPIRRALPEFGGESLGWLPTLEKTGQAGIYDVRIEHADPGTRRFILCDDAFPGEIGPQSIRSFYERGLDRIHE